MKERTVVLEDAVMVKDSPCTAGSKALENFTAPFDACAVEKLKGAGYEIKSTPPPGEFCSGGVYGDGGARGAVKAVCEGSVYALCNDFWGGARRQALQYGLAYLYPAYGRVSRYGLVQSVSSMDQIGVLARKPEDAFELLQVISGYDGRDGMSLRGSDYRIPDKKKKISIGKFEEVFPLKEAFLILAAAEFANNVSRYDGVKFGYRAKNYKNINDLYVKTRTEAFGPDTKLYAVLGNIVLSQEYYAKYYDKARRIRRLVKNALDKALAEYDVIEIIPGSGTDCFTLSPLTGCPSLTFVKGGTGVTALAKRMDEDSLYAYAGEVNA